MRRMLPVVAAVVVLGASGVVHGVWTHRWGASRDLDAAAARCLAVPAKIGDWEGEQQEVDARSLQIAEVRSHLARKYVHERSGQEAVVLLLCGRPGPLAVHTPDICFPGAGFHQVGETAKFTVKTADGTALGELWTATFQHDGPTPEVIRVCWGWSAGRTWQASDQPRVTFARAPALYKLYVVCHAPTRQQSAQDSAGGELLRALLPELRTVLSPTTP